MHTTDVSLESLVTLWYPPATHMYIVLYPWLPLSSHNVTLLKLLVWSTLLQHECKFIPPYKLMVLSVPLALSISKPCLHLLFHGKSCDEHPGFCFSSQENGFKFFCTPTYLPSTFWKYYRMASNWGAQFRGMTFTFRLLNINIFRSSRWLVASTLCSNARFSISQLSAREWTSLAEPRLSEKACLCKARSEFNIRASFHWLLDRTPHPLIAWLTWWKPKYFPWQELRGSGWSSLNCHLMKLECHQ